MAGNAAKVTAASPPNARPSKADPTKALAAIPVTAVVAVVVAIAEVRVAIAFETLVSLAAFVGPVTCLRTIRSEMLDSFVIPPFRIRNAAIAVIPAIGPGRGCSGEDKKPAESESGKSNLSERERRQFHKSLQERARAGFGDTVLRNQTLVWWKGCDSEA